MKIVLLLPLLVSILAITPCVNKNAVGCLAIDVNNSRGWSYCQCLSCSPGLILSGSLLTCCASTVTPYCSECNSSNACIRCSGGYGFNSSNLCSTCTVLPNCTYCNSISAGCTQCLSTFALNVNVCQPCYLYMPYCRDCYSSKTLCFACNSSFYALHSSNTPNTCQFCNLTLQYCVNCNNINYCITCINNQYGLHYYSWQVQFCHPCNRSMAGCLNCSGLSYCLACQKDTYQLNSDTHRCVRCSYYLPHCIICRSNAYCLSCERRYGLTYLLNQSYMQVCQECQALMKECYYCTADTACTLCKRGVITKLGCTMVKGCIEVNSSIPVQSNCLLCDISFDLIPVNGKCYCIEGWIVDRYCTTIVGCTNLVVKNLQVVCENCNLTARFTLQNNTCVCMNFYYSQNDACLQICGDGYLAQLACDDGNLINGDGCSDQCQLEKAFSCSNNKDLFPATSCKFKGIVKLTLEGIYKVSNKNQIQIIFNIIPYIDMMKKMNLSSSIILNCKGTILTNSSISNRQLILIIDFSQDIQGKSSNIQIKFDPNYVRSPDFSLPFIMVDSTGQSLTYSSSVGSSQSSLMGMKIIGYLFIGAFILGSFSYRMIGVETIQTIQIMLNLQVCTDFFQNVFFVFSKLNIIYGQLITATEVNRDLMNTLYANLGYTFRVNINYLILAILNLLLIIIYLIAKATVIQIKCQNKELRKTLKLCNKVQAQQLNIMLQRQQKYQKIQLSIYNWLLFPFLIGFSYQIINVIIVQQTNPFQDKGDKYKMIIIFASFFAIAFAFFKEILQLFVKNSLHCCKLQTDEALIITKYKYVPAYLIYTFTMLLVAELTTFGIIIHSTFINTAVIIFYLIFISIYLPYKRIIDNISIIANQLTILITQIWIILKAQSFYNQHIEAILNYVLQGAIVLVLTFSFFRIIVTFKAKYSGDIQQVNKEQQNHNKQMIKQEIGNIEFRRFLQNHPRQQIVIPLFHPNPKSTKQRFKQKQRKKYYQAFLENK